MINLGNACGEVSRFHFWMIRDPVRYDENPEVLLISRSKVLTLSLSQHPSTQGAFVSSVRGSAES